jgi:hypothetical protein
MAPEIFKKGNYDQRVTASAGRCMVIGMRTLSNALLGISILFEQRERLDAANSIQATQAYRRVLGLVGHIPQEY